MAGHSTWANIQHRKGRQVAMRSKLFSRLSTEVSVAVRTGDPRITVLSSLTTERLTIVRPARGTSSMAL